MASENCAEITWHLESGIVREPSLAPRHVEKVVIARIIGGSCSFSRSIMFT